MPPHLPADTPTVSDRLTLRSTSWTKRLRLRNADTDKLSIHADLYTHDIYPVTEICATFYSCKSLSVFFDPVHFIDWPLQRQVTSRSQKHANETTRDGSSILNYESQQGVQTNKEQLKPGSAYYLRVHVISCLHFLSHKLIAILRGVHSMIYINMVYVIYNNLFCLHSLYPPIPSKIRRSGETPTKIYVGTGLNPPPTGGAGDNTVAPQTRVNDENYHIFMYTYYITAVIIGATCLITSQTDRKVKTLSPAVNIETGNRSLRNSSPLSNESINNIRSVSDTSKGSNNNSHNECPQNQNVSTRASARQPLRGRSLNTFRSSNTWDNDDDEDGEGNKRRNSSERLKHQCELSPVIQIGCNNENKTNKAGTPNNIPINSTQSQIDNNTSSGGIFEMSVFQGISKIWETAKNVNLFGVPQNPDRNSRIDFTFSFDSKTGDLPDISEIAYVLARQENPEPEEHTLGGNTDSNLPAKVLTGIALTPQTNNPRTNNTTLTKSSYKNRVRSKSESSTRTDPYDIPPSGLLMKRMKAKINNQRHAIIETPRSRTRCVSESETRLSESSIGCRRITETGRYTYGTNEENYFHLEHDFLDRTHNRRLHKNVIQAAIISALDVEEDFLPENRDTESSIFTVSQAWDPVEVERVSSSNILDDRSQQVNKRNCLLYLLGRIKRNYTYIKLYCTLCH